MPSDSLERFNYWAERIDALLKKNDEHAMNELPDACKWLVYHSEKIELERAKDFAGIATRLTRLLGASALRLHSHYSNYLEKAGKHKKGTKVRLDKILRFVYHYGNYVHPSLIKSGKFREAEKILEPFWSSYLDELVRYRSLLGPHQIPWILRLAQESQEIGIKLDRKCLSQIEAEIQIREESNLALLEQLERDLEVWENQWLEFKQRATSDHELAEEIAGFATAHGGRIYVGVRPDKKLAGIDEIDPITGTDKQQRRIAHITRDIVKPRISLKVLFIRTEYGTVMRLDVPKGSEVVYYADYRPYIRDLSTTRKLEPSEVENLYKGSFPLS